MKRIIVTPAGRKEYLSILVEYLNYYKEEFNEWHLWCNSDYQPDIDYIYELEKKYNFIKVIPLEISFVKNCYAGTIPYFIKNDTIDEDSVYLRLDDDIVFIKKGSIKNIFDYRINNEDNFLVYGNIINNAVIEYIHQQIGALPLDKGTIEFNYRSRLGLIDPLFSQFCHENFFEKYNSNTLDKFYFEPFLLKDYTEVSIQVISWLGKTFKDFNGIIPKDVHEEDYTSVIRPKEIGKPNVVFGDSLFCHYSSQYTRDYLSFTNVLSIYEKIAKEYLK
jgi:hypothetical protein